MLLSSKLISLLTLTSTVAVASASFLPTPTRRTLSFNPTTQDLSDSVFESPPTSRHAPELLTNAKRLTAGLPPLRPRLKRNILPRTSPLPPVSTTCNILVTNNGAEMGYLSPTWNSFGEYGAMQSGTEGALQVAFSYSPSAPSQLSLTATNGPSATYPFLGAFKGFASTSSDLSSGSSNYAYIGGTAAGAPGPAIDGPNAYTDRTGSPEPYETAIWSYDPASGALTPQWINSSGDMPVTYIVYVDSAQAFALTGDPSQFSDNFGQAEIVNFTCQ